MSSDRFARRTFIFAGWLGLVLIVPSYFMEAQVGLERPPPVNHPEYYYGFLGVAFAWQILFLMLAKDPVRYRPLMIPCVLEKLSFGLALPVLFLLGRAPAQLLGFAAMDLVLAGLLAVAYWKTPAKS